MAAPFSNTHLRVPRGFGNLLEGLAKEVLRDQPEDIPSFAALYFAALLKAREESGLDPAEWGARLEDRFYNNHAFKVTATNGNCSSPPSDMRSKAGCSETFGTQNSISKNVDMNTSDNSDEVKQEHEEDMKLDEESGEAEHGTEIPYVGRADVDICAQEIKDPSEVSEQASENAEPTLLPSFGGLANVDVCAEEINPSLTELSESTYNNRDLESTKSFMPDGQQSESHNEKTSAINLLTESSIETPHIEQSIGKQSNDVSDDENTEEPELYGHVEDSEQEVSEMTHDLFEDTDPEEKSSEKVYLEEAAERTADIPETTSTAEAGQEAEEHIEENDELMDGEDQEAIHGYSSTYDFENENEPAAETSSSPSDLNSRSLMEMKDSYIDNSAETYNSTSEVIDVLDEVDHQWPINVHEHETENSIEEQSTSKILDGMGEEDLLESQTDALEPDFQLNDIDPEDTEDVTDNEISNTDIMDTSEKDRITENINDGSDLDSDAGDAEEIDQEEKDQTKSVTFDEPSSMNEQEAIKTDDETLDSELQEDVLPSETEEDHHMPFSEEAGKVAQIITDEHPTEAPKLWEQAENKENDEDHEEPFEDQTHKNQESKLDSENQDIPESSEQK